MPRKLLFGLGLLWAAPGSLIGLLGGGVGMCFGAKPKLQTGDFALVFHRFPWGPGGAITFGNVILNTHATLDGQCRTYADKAGWCSQPKTRIGDHERGHVLQYMALGPLFLPLYLLSGAISPKNRFERAADRYALTGRGWWPWSRLNSKAAYLAEFAAAKPDRDAIA